MFVKNLTLKVKDQLLQRLTHGNIEVGEFLESERLLATHFRVSRITLRNSLALLVKEEFLEKVITKGYQVKKLFKPAVTIYPIVFLHSTSYGKLGSEKKHRDIWDAATAEAAKQKISIIVYSIDGKANQEDEIVKLKKISPYIITDISDDKFIEHLVEEGFDVVRLYYHLSSKLFDIVTMDNYQSTYEATEFLIKKGHCKIGYIDRDRKVGHAQLGQSSLRLNGYLDCMVKNGLEPLIEPADVSYNLMNQASEKLLGGKVTSLLLPYNRLYSQLVDDYKKVSPGCEIDVVVWGEPKEVCDKGVNIIWSYWDYALMGKEAAKKLVLKILNGETGSPSRSLIPAILLKKSEL